MRENYQRTGGCTVPETRTAICPKSMGIWPFFSVLPLEYSHRGVSVPSVESG